MSDGRNGRILTFYSFKGGTGRTMALANMAWILASNGYRVLAIDWDLEAPGLHRYFHPFLIDKELATTQGLIDMVFEYQRTLIRQPESETLTTIPPEWYDENVDVFRYITELNWTDQRFGALHLLTAGRQNADYGARVNTFNWRQLYDRAGGYELFESVKRQVRAEYDYILIDSRTGVSDTSGLCTVQMPDTLVVCFTLNSQSIEGAGEVALGVRDQRKKDFEEAKFRVFPVPTRLEKAEKQKLEFAREAARVKFDTFVDHLSAAERDRYWGRIEIFYEPFYAYEEVLATFADKPGILNTLLASIERLTEFVTEGKVRSLSRAPEASRQEVLARYERRAGDPSDPARRLAAFFRRLTSEESELARKVLLRTVLPGVAGTVSRRSVAVADFRAASRSMAYRLTDDGILSRKLDEDSGMEYVTLADEATLQAWPTLRGWVSEASEDLRRRFELETLASAWDRFGKNPELLLRGEALRTALGAASDEEATPPAVTVFLQESRLQEERKAEKEKKEQEERVFQEERRAEKQREEREFAKALSEEREKRDHLVQEELRRSLARQRAWIRGLAMAAAVVGFLALVVIFAAPRVALYWRWYHLQTRSFAVDGLQYVWIPPGRFTMGCALDDQTQTCNESPPVRREVSQGYWMGITEVPNSAYHHFLAAKHPERASLVPQDNYPATTMTWFDAVDYCSWAGGRLPQSYEWEYSARAGVDGQRYITGNTPDEKEANINSDRAKPVASYQRNRFGLYDMMGNVAEWTADPAYSNYSSRYGSSYGRADPQVNLAGFRYQSEPGPFIVRGGSFMSVGAQLQLHVISVNWYEPGDKAIGFRCVIPASEVEQVGQAYKISPFNEIYAGASRLYWYSPWTRYLYRDWFYVVYAKYLSAGTPGQQRK